MNERLRTTMLRKGVSTDQLATVCGVDVKSVERWLSLDRVPHRKHRWTAANLLGADETFLWPDAVAVRDREERLGGTLPAKIRASLTYYRPLIETDGCDIRLHSTTLYNSMFRYDDDLLVNAHVYGAPASLNPTFQFHRIDGGTTFDHYADSFDKVWESAMPWRGAEV